METKKKTFDAIEMSQRLRREVSAMTAKMTREEELAFFSTPVSGNSRRALEGKESSMVREEPPKN